MPAFAWLSFYSAAGQRGPARRKDKESLTDKMRLDKYLKVSRLIKRRTVACDACNAGRVSVNGKPQKASYEVKVGDRIEIRFGEKAVLAEVLSTEETTKKEAAKELYRYL